MVMAELAGGFDVLGSSPRFAADWRWFKGLCGLERDFNRHVLAEYRAGIHNFFDHRCVLPARDPARNAEFESAALAVARSVRQWEAAEVEDEAVEAAVRRVMAGMADLPANWSAAFDEFLDAFADPATHARNGGGLTALRSSLRPRDDLSLIREARIGDGYGIGETRGRWTIERKNSSNRFRIAARL